MKKAEQLAKQGPTGSMEHSRLATTLRQTAGRVRAAAGADVFSEKERKVLQDAITILEGGAKVRRQAAALKAKVEREEEARRKEIAKHVSKTFGALQTIEGKVALLAAVDRHRLMSVRIENMADLTFYIKESIDDLAWTLARQDGKPDAVVGAAWAKFCAARQQLEEEHAPIAFRVRRAVDSHSTD